MIGENKQKQQEILIKKEEHTKADESFIIGASHLLELAQRASSLFERSKTEQKRQLINFVFSNLRLEGQTLHFNLKEPFSNSWNFIKSQLAPEVGFEPTTNRLHLPH